MIKELLYNIIWMLTDMYTHTTEDNEIRQLWLRLGFSYNPMAS